MIEATDWAMITMMRTRPVATRGTRIVLCYVPPSSVRVARNVNRAVEYRQPCGQIDVQGLPSRCTPIVEQVNEDAAYAHDYLRIRG